MLSFLWPTGLNYFGQLGRSFDPDVAMKPNIVRLPFRGSIIAVATGGSHMLVVDDRGVAWSCGRNTYGQLGYGQRDNERHPELNKVSLLPNVKVQQVAAVENFSLLLTKDEMVLSCGDSGNGSLGLGDRCMPDPVIAPSQVFFKKNVKIMGQGHVEILSIGAKNDSAWAITQGGDLWTWGANDSMQTGHSNEHADEKDRIVAPLKLDLEDGWKARVFSGSEKHSLLLVEVQETESEKAATVPAWVCCACTTPNPEGATKCVACTAAKPHTTSFANSSFFVNSTAASTEPTAAATGLEAPLDASGTRDSAPTMDAPTPTKGAATGSKAQLDASGTRESAPTMDTSARSSKSLALPTTETTVATRRSARLNNRRRKLEDCHAHRDKPFK